MYDTFVRNSIPVFFTLLTDIAHSLAAVFRQAKQSVHSSLQWNNMGSGERGREEGEEGMGSGERERGRKERRVWGLGRARGRKERRVWGQKHYLGRERGRKERRVWGITNT